MLISLDLIDAADAWRVIGNSRTGEAFDITFRPEDNDAASTLTNFNDYLREPGTGLRNRLLLVDKPIAGLTREYVRQFVHIVRPIATSTTSTYFCAYGIPTPLSDTLPAAQINYPSFRIVGQGMIQGGPQGGTHDLGESLITLSANPSNGQITARLELIGRLPNQRTSPIRERNSASLMAKRRLMGRRRISVPHLAGSIVRSLGQPILAVRSSDRKELRLASALPFRRPSRRANGWSSPDR